MSALPPLILCALLAGSDVTADAAADATTDATKDAAADSVADGWGVGTVLRFTFGDGEDRDFDQQPDDWSRRHGPGFPHYVPAEIDRSLGQDDSRSLRFAANAGGAVLYSPPLPIDAEHVYDLSAWLWTAGLSDAAMVSVSFLNHKRQRVQRWLGPPVTGTHADWVPIHLAALAPTPDVRFVVVGCHLVPGAELDLRGQAWFDAITLRRRPRLELGGAASKHFLQPDEPVRVTATLSGLDPAPPTIIPLPAHFGPIPWRVLVPQASYRLRLDLLDSGGQVVQSETLDLEPDPSPSGRMTNATPRTTVWEIAPPGVGFYRVRAALDRNGVLLTQRSTTFVVLEAAPTSGIGEFGWSVRRDVPDASLAVLASVAAQSGVNWVKMPVWSSVTAEANGRDRELADFFVRLKAADITPVGVLSDPPVSLRRQFGSAWSGASDVFKQKPSVWRPHVEPVLARYSSTIRHWQLGGEYDASFNGISGLEQMLGIVKTEFDRIGRDVLLGVPWEASLPPLRIPHTFAAIYDEDGGPITGAQPAANQPGAAPTEPPAESPTEPPAESPAEAPAEAPAEVLGQSARWVTVRALPRDGFTDAERGADLLRRIVAAKIGGADVIMLADAVGSEDGLLAPDGGPTPLYLTWRAAALALRGSEFIGSFILPLGSENYVFCRPDGEAVMVAWSAEPVTESFYFGEPDRVKVTSAIGEVIPATFDAEKNGHRLPIGPQPVLVRGGVGAVAQWRVSAGFERGRLPSETGAHSDAIIGRNPFGQGVNGTVSVLVPDEWEVEPRQSQLRLGSGEAIRRPLLVTLPPNVPLGPQWIALDYDIDADRKYRFRVYRPYHIGLGDVGMEVTDRRRADGALEIELNIHNNTEPEEVLNFQCSLFIPGAKRQRLTITELRRGRGTKVFVVPNADRYRGEEFWIRAEEINGRRVLNSRWPIGRDW